MPQIYNYWRDSYGRATTLGRCTDCRLKHTPSLSVKEANCSSGSFGLRRRLQVWHPSRGLGVPGSSVVKNLPANARDAGLIPGSGISPEGGHGNPLQYICLENPMDRGAYWATVHRAAQNQTQLRRLSTQAQNGYYKTKRKVVSVGENMEKLKLLCTTDGM